MRALLLLLVLASPASAVPLPLVCDLTSEEDPAFVIRLNKRTRTALRGVLTHQRKTLGTMSSSKPNQLRQSIWSFQSGDITHSGTAVLFADDKVWNPFKRLPKPQETNRVLFVGLDNALRSWKPKSFHLTGNCLSSSRFLGDFQQLPRWSHHADVGEAKKDPWGTYSPEVLPARS